jgi:nucleoid-associated protein YgaU
MTAIDGPVCDRCGLEQANYRFCPGCHLFVCSSCWEEGGGVCLSCARPNLPGPGQVPASIRSTIGERSLAVPAGASRLERALTGPSGEPAPSAGTATGTRSRPTSRGSRVVRAVLLGVLTATLLLLSLYAGPVLAPLVSGGARVSPTPVATPESSVRTSQSTPRPERRTYVVRAGDTLRSIALARYGDAERWRAIYRANRATIQDPDELQVGTRLTIP